MDFVPLQIQNFCVQLWEDTVHHALQQITSSSNKDSFSVSASHLWEFADFFGLK